jgi:hypothetical protein
MTYLNRPPSSWIGGSIEVTDKGTTLPDVPALAIVLENWQQIGDEVFETENVVDVIYGFGGHYSHWLRPGGVTGEWKINNLREVNLRTPRPGEAVTIHFSYLSEHAPKKER